MASLFLLSFYLHPPTLQLRKKVLHSSIVISPFFIHYLYFSFILLSSSCLLSLSLLLCRSLVSFRPPLSCLHANFIYTAVGIFFRFQFSLKGMRLQSTSSHLNAEEMSSNKTSRILALPPASFFVSQKRGKGTAPSSFLLYYSLYSLGLFEPLPYLS